VNILLLLDTFFTAYVITALVQTAKRPRIYVFALWSSILLTALQWTLFGQRMSMLAPPVILLYWIHQRRPSRTVLALGYAAIGLFVGTVGVIALLVIGQMRGRNELQFSRAAAESKNVVTDKSRGGPLYDAYDQVQIKFDGISMGAFLVQYFGSGTAGFRPYLGSMLALVPRAVLPSKPIPGSVDDTYFGTPPRLVAINVGYDPLTANVGVSPASVEIWHFGYLGLIPLILINVLHWRLMNSFLSAPSLIVRVLAVYLIVVPAFIGFFNSGDIIIMNEERVLALYVLLSIAPYLLYRPGRRRLVRAAEPEPQTA
ncbi:MAG: hypothetical protein JOZ54_11810, partial [Acidobacteria bacterium]|nr:hypothetical protein [Acidobacteriota bacterium]